MKNDTKRIYIISLVSRKKYNDKTPSRFLPARGEHYYINLIPPVEMPWFSTVQAALDYIDTSPIMKEWLKPSTKFGNVHHSYCICPFTQEVEEATDKKDDD